MNQNELISHRNNNSVLLSDALITSWNRVEYTYTEKENYGLSQKCEITNDGALVKKITINDYEEDKRLDLDKYLGMVNKIYINSGYYIESTKEPSVVRISYEADKINPHIVDYNLIKVNEGQKLTVVFDYNSAEDIKSLRNSATKIQVAEGGELELVTIQRLALDGESFGAVLVDAHAYSKISQYFIDLGGFIAGNSNRLYLGEASNAETYSIYIADGERKVDLEFSNFHKGRRSQSLIEGRGIVKDKARKVFRGNLKFERGSAKSVGKESEYAILLSKDVKASSIPTLKCDEDDVIGEHAASAGQIDKDKLFYLTSRGLSPKEAERLVVLSAFKPILEKIGDKELEAIVLEEIERRV